MCLNTQQQLLDTIESLENRLEKHSKVIFELQNLIKECTGSRMSEGVADSLLATIKEIYK